MKKRNKVFRMFIIVATMEKNDITSACVEAFASVLGVEANWE